MPVFQYDPDEGNYWGYLPLNFFAPHSEYAMTPKLCHQFAEFREMVDSLHEAGTEVIPDVVYNHTTEPTHEGMPEGWPLVIDTTESEINKFRVSKPFHKVSAHSIVVLIRLQ